MNKKERSLYVKAEKCNVHTAVFKMDYQQGPTA